MKRFTFIWDAEIKLLLLGILVRGSPRDHTTLATDAQSDILRG